MNDASKKIPDDMFEFLKEIINGKTGIVISQNKKQMLFNRVMTRVNDLQMQSIEEYCNFLQNDEEELNNYVNAMTTNFTSFFREKHHFDFLKSVVIKEFKESKQDDFRLWCAGSSTGEEPYTIMLTLLEGTLHKACSDLKVLATDIDTQVLKAAKDGVYIEDKLQLISGTLRERYFDAVQHQGKLHYKVKDYVKDYLFFKQLNLISDWPIKNQFDVIFCRNVLIYFDRDTQNMIIKKLGEKLKAGGYLFLGHTESVYDNDSQYESLGKTIFRKK